MGKVICVGNQKGGVGKTTTCVNLGTALAQAGERVCLIDLDPQGNLTQSLGYRNPDEIECTIAEVLKSEIKLCDNLSQSCTADFGEYGNKADAAITCEKDEEDPELCDNLSQTFKAAILHHTEGLDLLPGNIELAGLEVSMVNLMSRELFLKMAIQELRKQYTYTIIDCMPSLGMLTINALAAADEIITPVQAAYLPAKGLEQFLLTVSKVRRQINRRLKMEGILLSMVDARTNYAKEIISLIYETYGNHIRIFQTQIPFSVRASEASASGCSIFTYDPRGKVAEAYRSLAGEVAGDGR